jgi:AP endonuclease-2
LLPELKITRDKVDRNMACMESFDSFFSFYRRSPPKGYSGTGIFTKRKTVVPLKAEEGISSALLEFSPSADQIGGYPSSEETGLTPSEIRDLDLEGRATVVDCGLFVLINLYCPNETNDLRLEFKNAFNLLLESRIRHLIDMGREVIVVGDLNISPLPIDHCDPYKRAAEHGLLDFTEHPSRVWFNALTGSDGILIDVCRSFHPTRERMFTCWDTRTNARCGVAADSTIIYSYLY